MLNELKKTEVQTFLNNFFPQYKISEDPFERYLGYFDRELVGIVAYSIIYERAEINYICVKQEYQGKHIGSLLLDKTVENIKTHNCLSISLEVRKDNIKAINLYKKYDFKQVSVRKKYYNGVDALLMVRKLGD